jgi:hypothetical protein
MTVNKRDCQHLQQDLLGQQSPGHRETRQHSLDIGSANLRWRLLAYRGKWSEVIDALLWQADTAFQGLSNEHICASALYYYDSSNVTESHLAIRENVNEEILLPMSEIDHKFPPGPGYEQNRFGSLIEIYGLDEEGDADYVRATSFVSLIVIRLETDTMFR